VNDLIEILRAMAAKKGEVENPKELFLDMADRVVKTAVNLFGAKPDEVAILMLTSDEKHLRFVAPRKLAELGTIPVTKRDSIAVTVLNRKTGDVNNNVPMVKHVAFFESVRLRESPAPIQKMITLPILHEGHAFGVAQISRKGDSLAAAGPDFTSADLRRAQELFTGVAAFLVEARPERF
jgi:hypothetical protein